MSETVHCDDCGEVIGAYEPMITLMEGHAMETSRVAEPRTASRGAECYHRGCFERRHGDVEIIS
jgi:hypothetical protein